MGILFSCAANLATALVESAELTHTAHPPHLAHVHHHTHTSSVSSSQSLPGPQPSSVPPLPPTHTRTPSERSAVGHSHAGHTQSRHSMGSWKRPGGLSGGAGGPPPQAPHLASTSMHLPRYSRATLGTSRGGASEWEVYRPPQGGGAEGGSQARGAPPGVGPSTLALASSVGSQDGVLASGTEGAAPAAGVNAAASGSPNTLAKLARPFQFALFKGAAGAASKPSQTPQLAASDSEPQPAVRRVGALELATPSNSSPSGAEWWV